MDATGLRQYLRDALRGSLHRAGDRIFRMRIALSLAAFALASASPALHAAQVQHLTTQTATATGAGAAGTPTISSFSIPGGMNRALFVWATFERDHCSPADGTGGLCATANTAGTGLGDNWP